MADQELFYVYWESEDRKESGHYYMAFPYVEALSWLESVKKGYRAWLVPANKSQQPTQTTGG